MNLVNTPLDCIEASRTGGCDSHPLAAYAQFRGDVTYRRVRCELDAAHQRDAFHPVFLIGNSSRFVDITGPIHRGAQTGDDPALLLVSQVDSAVTQRKLCCGDSKL